MTSSGIDGKHHAHWQALLDLTRDGVCGIDLHGNCTYVNRVASTIFGWESEELVGSHMHTVIHHHYPDGRNFPPEECPIHDVLRNQVSIRQKPDTLFRKDGSSFRAEVSVEPVKVEGDLIGLVITMRELEPEVGSEERQVAERRTAELKAVMESIPSGVYVAAPGRTLQMNRRAKVMSGSGFPPELNTLHRALAGESSTDTAESAGRWIRSVGTPVILDETIVGAVVVNTDVTQTRVQDEALRKSEKLAAVGQLASSIAHEINNPLESITNLLYLIQNASSMDEVQEYAEVAQGELARVTEITLQTLRFHRQQTKATEVDLAELARTVMSLYTGRLLVRDITVEWKVGAVPRVLCLEGEIRQVLNNLVRNALDAMSESGGRLLIRVHTENDPRSGLKGVRLTVADTGEGISPAIAPRLFEPFQTTKERTGTGLGLWVSKGIVEKHGGYIRTRSRRGERHGAIFAVWLPILPDPNSRLEAAH